MSSTEVRLAVQYHLIRSSTSHVLRILEKSSFKYNRMTCTPLSSSVISQLLHTNKPQNSEETPERKVSLIFYVNFKALL